MTGGADSPDARACTRLTELLDGLLPRASGDVITYRKARSSRWSGPDSVHAEVWRSRSRACQGCISARYQPRLAAQPTLICAESRKPIMIQLGMATMASAADVGVLIESARVAAGLSQRALADVTGISQPTLSRIISGDRVAKLPEVVAIAWATGHTVAQLTGAGTVADRVQCAARATNDSGMEGMRQALLHFLELDDYLDDQAIPATVRRGVEDVNAEAEGRTCAEQFRHDHHLSVQPLGDLVAVIEQATWIDVTVLDVGPDEHSLTMRDLGHNTVFIGVARTRNPMRRRSTLAHELGHVLFEDWADNDVGNWSDRSPEEVRADAFARHLLLPLDGLREFLDNRKPIPQSTLSAVVQRFLALRA